MKNSDLKSGSVFFFPYLWKKQSLEGVTDSKDRTCCLAFETTSLSGRKYLIILPISDRPDDPLACVEISAKEKRLAGLDEQRAAYVHIAEYNLDPLIGSIVRRSRSKITGRFSEAFARQITEALAKRMRVKLTTAIDRRK